MIPPRQVGVLLQVLLKLPVQFGLLQNESDTVVVTGADRRIFAVVLQQNYLRPLSTQQFFNVLGHGVTRHSADLPLNEHQIRSFIENVLQTLIKVGSRIDCRFQQWLQVGGETVDPFVV